ncbi:7-carboxy-7-deazaguanine synthase QueE [Reichenbachiella carrageenanivorans]|uniref:7-carboxy-7-deazaguanine synthase n=1 Tax=Reichenbachiella carrageenanivorans TaxID=2979869 RepID=A0ABY6D6V1_9BACT|nr:7-carboxy-7-deazaguanine synthase QueE [Reichenbachiella carrageenanivorans]UXX81345.1 7-carboxy-7-deazaguanine synthase QueE [Reichenbachiella carrageenanivorans]
MEIFYSIQGEGFYSGKPAIFVRLGGCDVGCVWCDVKESWNEADHPFFTIEAIIKELSQYPCKTLIITGGEPLMYDLTALTSELKAAGYRLHIETSGAYPMSGTWDWVCFSPKKFKAPHESVYGQAHELKAIVFNKSDFKFAEEHAAQVGKGCMLYLQPEWGKADQMTGKIIDYAKAHAQWNISLQTHKYLNIP